MNNDAPVPTYKIKNSSVGGARGRGTFQLTGKQVVVHTPNHRLNYNQRMNFLSYVINITLYGYGHHLTSMFGINR